MKSLIWQGAMAAIVGVVLVTAGGPSSIAFAEEGQRIRIRMGEQSVTATLNNSDAARDLVKMLPVTLEMRDHMRREKTGHLPGPLSERTRGVPTYATGDLGYWRPGGNFVIFYLHDGLTIPSPGIVPLGKVDSGVEIFDIPGSVSVTVELID